MGCLQSKRPIYLGGRPKTFGVLTKQASGTVSDSTGDSVVSHFSGNMLGLKRDQDRFVLAPKVVEGVLLASVFDGHAGEDGGKVVAEGAGAHIPGLLAKSYKTAAKTADISNEMARCEVLKVSIAEAFNGYQAVCQDNYDKNVMAEVIALKARMEKESGVDLPLIRPQEGGTTATAAMVTGKQLLVAWVGDSRGVLASKPSGGGVVATALTEDHDVKHAAELARIQAAKGQLCDNYISVDGAEGYMQLTRTLGDCAFHRGDAVLATPETSQRTIGPDDMFVILASDGLWNTFTNEEACAFVYEFLIENKYRADDPNGHQLILRASVAMQEQARDRCAERKVSKDDIGVIILTLAPFWTAHAASS